MSDANHDHGHSTSSLSALKSGGSPAVAVFAVVLFAALGAAGAVYGLSDLLGLGVAAVIAVAGGAVAAAAAAAGKPAGATDAKATALLEAVTAENAPVDPPSRFRGAPWAELYRLGVGYSEAQRSATLAVQEVERLRRELEQRPGAEDSTAPVAHFVPPDAPYVARPEHDENELVGASDVPVAAPADAARSEAEIEAEAEARARKAVADAVVPIEHDLASIESALAPLVQSLRDVAPASRGGGNGQPAKMVDALVRTAADGIEDLAAGLMRANELAGVAERVTNRATLLALNAALEATRSGSEAFASIAEETRRLAEFAREATDTISRLSNEIELKVGETIASIQASSEDAKAAVDSMRAGGESVSRGPAPETLTAFEGLLARVRDLRQRAAGVGNGVSVSTTATPPSAAPVSIVSKVASDEPTSPTLQHAAPAPAYVSLGLPRSDDAPVGDAPGEGEVSDDPGVTASASGEPSVVISFQEVPIGDPPSTAPTSIETSSDVDAPVEADSPEAVTEPSSEPDSSTSPAPAPGAGLPVVPKIPDWLEGLEPRGRR